MQLVAYGAQDIYLTGNPMITYFKIVYRRHTNFSIESIEQTFNGRADFGSKITSMISRNGDLIHSIYLQLVLPDLTYTATSNSTILRWTDDIGHHLIKEVSVDIGGQIIDVQSGDWMEIWAQLTVPAGKMPGYREMIGQDPRTAMGMNTGLQAGIPYVSETQDDPVILIMPGREIYVPLQFWFCRNVGLALPLIALQYHEVKINMELRNLSELIVAVDCNVNTGSTTGTVTLNNIPTGHITDINLWVDYIYLDTDERRRFAQVSHEYLIEQVQYTGENTSIGGADLTLTLEFNHPVKELVWVCQFESATSSYTRQYSNYTTISPIITMVGSEGLCGGISTIGDVEYDEPTTSAAAGAQTATNIRVFGNQSFSRPPGGTNIVSTACLTLNGNVRFAQRAGEYFNWVQCKNHHTNVPTSPGINVYSFAIHPETHQPSGTCNFSRVDVAKLILTFNQGLDALGSAGYSVAANFGSSNLKVRVYAFNYNILRVMSGMGGLAY